MSYEHPAPLWRVLLTIVVGLVFGSFEAASAASVSITWADNSSNEDGFRIERRVGTSSYQSLANVAANITSYTDASVSSSTTYCYRVAAFNSSGSSDYSNENCATTATPSYTLTVTPAGTGQGTVTSTPAGISCVNDCSEAYQSNTVVRLTAVASSGSSFTGWSGHSDCSDGLVTMTASMTCTATFSAATVTPSYTLTVTRAGTGQGTVTSSPLGIDCNSDCSHVYQSNTVVRLSPLAATGSSFTGWTGNADCSDGIVTVTANITCTASFSPLSGGRTESPVSLRDRIGIYRPSTGEWLLDLNGNGSWDDCQIDLCLRLFTGSDALPVVGDWNASGTSKVGLFAADSSEWFIDANGNDKWDGCEVDICASSFGAPTDMPLAGRWKTGSEDRLAIFRPSENRWYLDLNGNERLQSCKTDRCASFNIYQTDDLPVTGDWTARGTTQVGLFRPSTGEWFLDRNSNNSWNGCKKDLCIASFGRNGDLPVTGDWDGTGATKIGVFRPSTREWFLDLNGDGRWDPTVDLHIAGFGQPGDVPVVGKW